MSKSKDDFGFMEELMAESKQTLKVQTTEEDPYSGYEARFGTYHAFRDKSIVTRLVERDKKTNFYHKLHLPIKITTREDYTKLWHLVTSFVQDYPEVSMTKIISIDKARQPGKEAVVYFAPDFWEGYKSEYQMLRRQKEIMEDINGRLISAGLSFSVSPVGDIPLDPANEQSLVYISAPEYTINADGSYGEYIYAKDRECGFFNPYDEENLAKLNPINERNNFSFFSLIPSPYTQLGMGIAIFSLAAAATIALIILVKLNILSMGLALPLTIVAVGVLGAVLTGTAGLRDESSFSM